jgi:hypothetical protein
VASYGGTLTVTTNAGDAPFVAGDTFQLFKAESSFFYSGFQRDESAGIECGTGMEQQPGGQREHRGVFGGAAGAGGVLCWRADEHFCDAGGDVHEHVEREHDQQRVELWGWDDRGEHERDCGACVCGNAGTYTVSLVESGAGGSNTNTAANYVVVKPKVVIGGVTVTANGKLVFSGTNGPAGQEYRILTTTNVAMPLGSWTPVWTNVFGANGSYNYTNTPG